MTADQKQRTIPGNIRKGLTAIHHIFSSFHDRNTPIQQTYSPAQLWCNITLGLGWVLISDAYVR